MKRHSGLEAIYFIGIGGIGMSAIARYYLAEGISVYGYDRTESSITEALISEGCFITYNDDPDTLPVIFRNPAGKEKLLVVYTPAIPRENNIITWFRENNYRLYKRSEILGDISKNTDTLAVSGTHGKTTISTMLAHLLRQSGIDCSAFLGGISKNYNSNLLIGSSNYTVMEADEFDRSFHHLRPLIAVVTSVDPDHLDIYGDHQSMIDGYNEFCRKIRNKGTLVVNLKIRDRIIIPDGIDGYTYGLAPESDYHASGIERDDDCYRFDLTTPHNVISGLRFRFPGEINIENAVAASAVALMCGAKPEDLKSGLLTFTGVQRRFDIRINRPGLVYIDDYAHHPEEIKACITSVREYFGGRKITGIFQPHLFSRTKDHAEGFARILDLLDEVILLPVYPAREKPVPGVSSSLIFERMKIASKRLLEKDDLPGKLDLKNIDVLLTIGAGDIDRLVEPIENALNRQRPE
jgi:UDP-N-acetylmuramate--alanine ligase